MCHSRSRGSRVTIRMATGLDTTDRPRRRSGKTGEPGTTGTVTPTRRSSADLFVRRDRKSTRLNSSHQIISYAVFCLKKKKNKQLILFITKKKKKTKNIKQ